MCFYKYFCGYIHNTKIASQKKTDQDQVNMSNRCVIFSKIRISLFRRKSEKARYISRDFLNYDVIFYTFQDIRII